MAVVPSPGDGGSMPVSAASAMDCSNAPLREVSRLVVGPPLGPEPAKYFCTPVVAVRSSKSLSARCTSTVTRGPSVERYCSSWRWLDSSMEKEIMAMAVKTKMVFVLHFYVNEVYLAAIDFTADRRKMPCHQHKKP